VNNKVSSASDSLRAAASPPLTLARAVAALSHRSSLSLPATAGPCVRARARWPCSCRAPTRASPRWTRTLLPRRCRSTEASLWRSPPPQPSWRGPCRRVTP
jgi:hypothetical protein